MNLNPKYYEFIKKLIDDFNCMVTESEQYIFEFKDFFDVSLEECIERDSKRPNSVGEEVIKTTYEKYKSILKGGEK